MIKKEPTRVNIEFIDSLNKNKIPYALITNNTSFLAKSLKLILEALGFVFEDPAYIDPTYVSKSYVGKEHIRYRKRKLLLRR